MIAHHDLPPSAPGLPACRIAYCHKPAAAGEATVVFLPGYMSDMAGSKAQAVLAWTQDIGAGCLLLDYSGCGASSGDFADGSLSLWRDEVLALIEAHVPGPVVLAGSSMGGWLMLLVALALPAGRVRGLLGIAAAPDFTQWGYSPAQQRELAAGHTVFEPNPYGPEPTPTHARFWADGQANLLLGGAIAYDGPVHLLQGQADADVPWQTALDLAAALRSAQVQVCLVKDGDHRLSREGDIALILSALRQLLAA
ncbi:MAG TPA: alpha/beta hydrolase [Novosphingobium sp.]|nr:alpha/beta hydrolase [Novosphingobium sp.]